MILAAALFIATCFLAYANGSNDNFKGVATLFGSDTTNYRRALWWATLTTAAGSVCSVFLAQTLIHNFSGKGLVPDAIAGKPDFLLAVVIGAALTVILATLSGFPISTTHSLIGALVGSGLMAVGAQVNLLVLGNKFFLPLLLSPFVAFVLATVFYMILRCVRIRVGVTKEMCFCVGQTERTVAISQPAATMSLRCVTAPDVSMDLEPNCSVRYSGQFLAVNAQKLLDLLHYLSAGIVSFARGLNDTPKIVAMLIAVKALAIELSMVSVAVAMALGGLLSARKVAHKMSKEITTLNHGQGFTANLVTGILVIFASHLGLAVSTTHVSVGSLFGIGTVTRTGNKGVISGIILSWVVTLPVAAALAAVAFWVIH
jgi:PiT family inorganic phosphate transporter